MKSIQKKICMLLAVIVGLGTVILFHPESVEAGVFDNAYSFYGKYKSEMVFQPGEDNEGEIYYATKGKKAVTAGTQYTTIGWKVSMSNSKGKSIATLYYKLGGKHMVTVDTRLVDGYEYTLYRVTLDNMRSRISKTAQKALKSANCNIVFDACLALKVNGEIKGEMSEDGPEKGEVYTTYEEILAATEWSEDTKRTLKTYFNKTVEDIYYKVTLVKGEGVTEVSGAGRYCFGTQVTVSAVIDPLYDFDIWEGTVCSTNPEFEFELLGNVKLTATARKKNLTVYYYKDSKTEASDAREVMYYHNTSNQKLKDFAWKKEGYHQLGWSREKDAEKAEYKMTKKISQTWLEEHLPSVNLYGVWEENSYKVIYHSMDTGGETKSKTIKYSQKLTLPKDTFTREGYVICGWSISKGSTLPEYEKKETISVKKLVKNLELAHTDGAEIHIYAVWNRVPVIEAGDIYVSLEAAQGGLITEKVLSQYVEARDEEDGVIKFGKNSYNEFGIINFSETDFTSFQKEGAVTQRFFVRDSDGNVAQKDIWIHIINTQLYDAADIYGRVRFTNSKYQK